MLDHFAWMPPKVAMLLCPGDFQQIQTINQEGTSISVKHLTSKQQNTNTTEESFQQILTSENPVVSSSKSVHRFNLPGPRYRCLTGRLDSRSKDFILNLIPLEVSPAGGVANV